MKKFELVYFSDCRWISEIKEISDGEFENGLDVIKFVKEEREFEDEEWVESVGNFIGNKNWVNEENWYENLLIGNGGIDSDLFVISMCDEFSEVMVIREDSKYYNKFKRDVKIDDEDNINLYYELSGVNDWIENISKLMGK